MDVLVKQAAEFSSKQILHVIADCNPTDYGIDLSQQVNNQYLTLSKDEYVEPLVKSDAQWWWCKKLDESEQ